MTNIAFIARAAGGKTTAADRLVDEHGYTRLGFADPLRTLGALHGTGDVVGWYEQIRLWTYRYRILDVLSRNESLELERKILAAFHKYPIVDGKNRPLLQNIGTDVGRGIDDLLWIKLLLARAEGCDTPVALDDCRFENEALALKQAGWLLTYIHAREATLDRRYAALYGSPMTPEQKAHASEAGIPMLRPLTHYVIHNDDDDPTSLYNEVDFLADAAYLVRSRAV